jgi:CheY-like chemotaxis protein
MNQPQFSAQDVPVRILVVDDHLGTATTLARAISQLGPGVSVIPATSGKEALERVKHEAADILITDMIMPEMTGLELIEKLQNHPAGRPTFIFLVTAYDVPGLKITASRLHVKEIFTKPVSPERICQTVLQAMEKISQSRPAPKVSELHKEFKILIADDQPDNLLLLARYLENEGYSYIQAKDGSETLEQIRSEKPDLVLLDVNMPNKDGFTALSEIRADPAIQHIPVIILTAARLSALEVQRGLNLGADDYITKPFDRRELLARIRTKLRVKESEDAIHRRNKELNVLFEIGMQLHAPLSVEQLAEHAIRQTVNAFGALAGHLVILDLGEPPYKIYQSCATAGSATYLPSVQALFAQILETRQGLVIDNIKEDSRWQTTPDDPTHSAVIVPVFSRADLLGLFILTHDRKEFFDMEQKLLLQAIANQMGMAVENTRLFESRRQKSSEQKSEIKD